MENGKNLIHSFNHIDCAEGNFKGLTKREYFAALAMQGILANPSLANLKLNTSEAMKDSVMIEYSIRMSDALLKQLEN